MKDILFWIIIIIVGLVITRVAKSHSKGTAKKIAESAKWPLDEWDMATQGLGYFAKLSRDEAIRRLRFSVVIADILFWSIIGISAIVGLLLYFG